MKRKAISKRVRFEVFKRDRFKCQYCGRGAPDVLLQVDHITAVANGGTGDIFNLLTSCEDCNAGKSSVPLQVGEALRKQKAELDRLQERREQIELMAKWQLGLVGARDDSVKALVEIWTALTGGKFSLNEHGLSGLRKLLSRFSFVELSTAMQTSVGYYASELDQKGLDVAFDKIGGCARMAQIERESPEVPEFYKIRGICRKRFPSVPWDAIQVMRGAFDRGATVETIRETALNCTWWRQFSDALNLATQTTK